eukprot:498333_1
MAKKMVWNIPNPLEYKTRRKRTMNLNMEIPTLQKYKPFNILKTSVSILKIPSKTNTTDEIIQLTSNMISTTANINMKAMKHLYLQPITMDKIYIIPTQRKNKIIFQKRLFTNYRYCNYKCANNISNGCKATISSTNNHNGEIINVISGPQSIHLPTCLEYKPTQESIFNHILYQMNEDCFNNKFTRPKLIYNRLICTYRKWFKENPGNVIIEMRDFPSFDQIKSTLYKKQSFSSSYTNPRNINETMSITIPEIFGKNYHEEWHIIKEPNKENLFVMKKYLGSKIIGHAPTTVDDPTYEFVTLYRNGTKSHQSINKIGGIYTCGNELQELFIGAYVLLKDSTAPTYKWMYKTTNLCIKNDNIISLTTKHLSDYEKNKRRQYEQVNPEVKQPGESFHIIQTWLRKLDSLGLSAYRKFVKKSESLQDPKFIKCVNQLESLPYVPIKHKCKKYDNIKSRFYIWQRNRAYTPIENKEAVLNMLDLFFYYMDIYFMEKPLKSGKLHKNAFEMKEWTVIVDGAVSTNCMESLHRWDVEEAGPHPSVVKGLIHIKNKLELEEDRYYRKIVMKKRNLKRRHKKIIKKMNIVSEAVQKLEMIDVNASVKLLNVEIDKIINAINANKKGKYYQQLNKKQKKKN